MHKLVFVSIFVASVFLNNLQANTENFSVNISEITDIKASKYVQYFMCTDSLLSVFDLINNTDTINFKKVTKNKLNFGYTTKDVWLTFKINNDLGKATKLFVQLQNPDIDYIEFYVLNAYNKLEKSVVTGELRKVSTRDVYHRYFVFTLDFNKNENKTIYLKANNSGHGLLLPVVITEPDEFFFSDNIREIFNWLIQGLFLFVILFNLYLYKSIGNRSILYFALTVIFATLFIFHYEGYNYLITDSKLIENLKWINPALYIVFLLKFAQSFTKTASENRLIRKFANLISVISLALIFFYSLSYPLSLFSDVGYPLIILSTCVLIVAIAIKAYDINYLPSKYFLFSFALLFIGVLVNQLKDFSFLSSSFLVENSIKISLAGQYLLLTIAELERFRIQQKESQKAIHDNLIRIELQNKELEIVNTELEKLSIVASETDNSIGIYSTTGKLEWCNQEFEWFYDVSFGELIKEKKDKIELIVPNERIRKLFDQCIDQKKPIIFETLLRSQNRRELWVQTTLSPYIIRGQVTKIISIDADISQLKKYEGQLEKATREAKEADRLKTVFLGNMSHEIRTPLNGIIGFSELLRNAELPQEKRTKFLKVIKDSGEQLIRIIDDIVDISLIESNQLKIQKENVNLAELFNEVEEFFQAHKIQINKKHIDLVFDVQCKKEQNEIITDGHRVKQVIMNLLKNGLKFTNEGVVKLICNIKDNSVIICIEDTGIGVKPEFKSIIFERFRQQEETLNRTFGGTGVGLSISKGIIDRLGGKIWLDSEFGPGARFCFSIPFITEEDIKNEEKILKSRSSNSVKRQKIEKAEILVVEDDDNSFFYLSELMADYNGNIQRATDGLQAVQLTKSNDFDIILMDINLPNMDGMTAVKKIREFNQSVPIIAQTAYAMVSEKNKIMSAGCNDYITKPINSKTLLKKLTKLIS